MTARACSALLLFATLVLAGCAWTPTVAALREPGVGAPGLLACADWYAALDARTEQEGVRDAGAARIAGFAHLRMDRFTASWRDVLGAAAQQPGADGRRAAVVQRLLALDLQARSHEIANLPGETRVALASLGGFGASADAMLEPTRSCGARLATYDLTMPAHLARLHQALVVPDDYVAAYRVLGLYGLSQLPFASGIRRFEAERRSVFARAAAPAPGTTRVHLSAPAKPLAGPLTQQDIAQMLAPAPDDPLRIPAPTPGQLEQLFAQFAPAFELDTATPDDQPGALVWRTGPSPGGADSLEVDSTQPVVYRQTATTRVGAHNLLQLVYTLWFPARTASGGGLDLLAGKLDGLVWRVTLAPDGTPLVYDTMHPCGCYHMFFPTPAAQPTAAPEYGIEWAFSPQSLPAVGLGDRVLLRIAAGTHYIDQLRVEAAADSSTRYAWRDYDTLRSLPAGANGQRSVFGPDGFIDGTDRPEAWLFWPMGIQRAGAMRQWGHHATAFVGRRHFDDADLMERRFVFDPRHFGR